MKIYVHIKISPSTHVSFVHNSQNSEHPNYPLHGLNTSFSSPSKFMSTWNLNVNFLRNIVSADVIKLIWGYSRLGWTLNPMQLVPLLKGGKIWTHRPAGKKTLWRWREKLEWWIYNVKDWWQWARRKAWSRFFPGTLSTTWFWTFNL